MAARGVGHDDELEPDDHPPEEPPSEPHDRRFIGVVAVAAVVGLAIRIVVLVHSRWDVALGQDDAGYYARQGRLISQGARVHRPVRLPLHRRAPGAAVGPAPARVLAPDGRRRRRRARQRQRDAPGRLRRRQPRHRRDRLLGREIAGRRVGMIAAGIAALYPVWWLSDSLLQAEALYMPLVAGTLLLAYRVWKRPSLGRAAALGFVGALAALTRSEGVLLLVLVAVCVLLLRHGLAGIRRFQLLAVVLLVAAATVAPWLVYNATRFDRPVLMSTNDGATLADTNCPAAYSGPGLGLYIFQCHVPAVDESGDESDRARNLTEVGLRYARDHADRLPVVVGRPGRDGSGASSVRSRRSMATCCTSGPTARVPHGGRLLDRGDRRPRRVLRAPAAASADLAAGGLPRGGDHHRGHDVRDHPLPRARRRRVRHALRGDARGARQPHLPHDQPGGAGRGVGRRLTARLTSPGARRCWWRCVRRGRRRGRRRPSTRAT